MNFRTGVENLEVASCTDKPCEWKNCQKKSLEQLYSSKPVKDIESFHVLENKYTVNEDFKNYLHQNALKTLPNSGFAKHAARRHKELKMQTMPNYELTAELKLMIRKIFENQVKCPLHKWIRNDVKCNFLYPCCKNTYDTLKGGYVFICFKTRLNYNIWKMERKHRMTGSRCYEIFTYSKNKNPDWIKKCDNFFHPSNFKNEYVEHGLINEGKARQMFIDITRKIVIETGLIVSIINPWIAYSPDGVIFLNGIPIALLEIKCPFKGKCMHVHDAIKHEFSSCLRVNKDGSLFVDENGNYKLKEKHKYYGQLQWGMFVLNVKKAFFAIYASYDKGSMVIIEVDFDENFVRKMLQTLKITYFNTMLHTVCNKN